MVGLIHILCTAVCLFICSRTRGYFRYFPGAYRWFLLQGLHKSERPEVNGWELSAEEQSEIHRIQGPWEQCKCVAEVLCRWDGEEDTCGGLQERNRHLVCLERKYILLLFFHIASQSVVSLELPTPDLSLLDPFPKFVMVWYVRGVILLCVLCREMLWEWESRGMRHMRCVHATWPERSSTGVLYKHSLGHEVSLTSVQFFFAVIKTLSMPVMQNRKHKENVFSSAIILACLCVYESFLLHLEGWDAELFSKEISKVHPHSSQQLAWQKGYSKWLALFPSILPLET